MIAAICPGCSREPLLDTRKIVERSDEDVVKRRFRHAGSAGNGVRCVGVAILFGLRFDAHQRGVMQSMIRAFELHNFLAARCSTRQSGKHAW